MQLRFCKVKHVKQCLQPANKHKCMYSSPPPLVFYKVTSTHNAKFLDLHSQLANVEEGQKSYKRKSDIDAPE